jgi:TonB family protein
MSFFAAKMFSSSQEEKEAVSASVPLAPLVPQLVGRVTTAEELLPIRIFGAAPNDELRGVAAFRAQVEAHVPGIREAYNVQMMENPQALGAVVLEFSVAPEGQVMSAAVHVTGNISRAVQQTILEAVQALRFAPVQGEEVKVFYPLLFSPERVDPVTFVSHIKEVWPGRYKVLSATAVPVRAEASDDAQEVGTIGPGLFLSVISSHDGWLGALSPKGKVGYVRQDAISPRIENTPGAEAKG